MSGLIFQTTDAAPVSMWEESGELFAFAADLARALGHTTTNSLLRRIPHDQRLQRSRCTLGGEQSVTALREGGIWMAAMGGRTEPCQGLRRFLADEVLPQIRKTGEYRPKRLNPIPALLDAIFTDLPDLDRRSAAQIVSHDLRQTGLDPDDWLDGEGPARAASRYGDLVLQRAQRHARRAARAAGADQQLSLFSK